MPLAPRSKACSLTVEINSWVDNDGKASLAVSFFPFRFALVAKLPGTRGSYLLFVIARRPL
jgi:hypothetical protein